MNYQTRALWMKADRFMAARMGCQLHRETNKREWWVFDERWREMNYYERMITTKRLARPWPQCSCLPTCIKL
jgi:hypothetical protein